MALQKTNLETTDIGPFIDIVIDIDIESELDMDLKFMSNYFPKKTFEFFPFELYLPSS